MKERLASILAKPRTPIAVIHLKPLPGSPDYDGDFESVIETAVVEARMLQEAGFAGVIVENYGDAPFLKAVPKQTIAAMAIIAHEVRKAVRIPVGINVLRNDYQSALTIAGMTGCEFVRINVLVGGYITPEGIIEGNPGDALRLRKAVAPSCLIFADVMVKHAYRIGETSLADDALDVALRGKADCLVITGKRTGVEPKACDVEEVRDLIKTRGIEIPIFVGSGVKPENAFELLRFCDGFIVGSYFRRDGRAGEPIDLVRLECISQLIKEVEDKRWD